MKLLEVSPTWRRVDLATDDLSGERSSQRLRDLWPEGIVYNGRSVRDIAYGENKAKIGGVEGQVAAKYSRNDWQESYLGYSPSTKTFYMGFDRWEGERLPSCFLRFVVREDGSTKSAWVRGIKGSFVYQHETSRGRDRASRMMPSPYDQLHAMVPDLIDLRLD